MPIKGANSFPPSEEHVDDIVATVCLSIVAMTMADLRGRVVPTMFHTMFWQIFTNRTACQGPLTLSVCKLSASKHLLVSALHLATTTVSRPHLPLNLEQTATTPILAMNLKQAAIMARLVTKLVLSNQQAGETEIASPGGQELSAILVMLIPLSQTIQQSCGSS